MREPLESGTERLAETHPPTRDPKNKQLRSLDRTLSVKKVSTVTDSHGQKQGGVVAELCDG